MTSSPRLWLLTTTVPWTEHKTNEEILQTVETEREIMDTVRSRQKTWLITENYVSRTDTGEESLRETKNNMLLDWLLKTEEGNTSYEELKMSAQDRSRWSQWRCKPAIWQNTAERFGTWCSHADIRASVSMNSVTHTEKLPTSDKSVHFPRYGTAWDRQLTKEYLKMFRKSGPGTNLFGQI